MSSENHGAEGKLILFMALRKRVVWVILEEDWTVTRT